MAWKEEENKSIEEFERLEAERMKKQLRKFFVHFFLFDFD
jgi:hypothetical protein